MFPLPLPLRAGFRKKVLLPDWRSGRQPPSSWEGMPVAQKPWVVSDELWELVEPLLPARERRFRYPGRRRLPDRECLSGILFVLHTGHPLAGPAARAGLRLGGDLLATPRGVASGRRLGAAAPAPSGATAPRRCDRLLAGHRRLQPGAGQKGGAKTGPSPVDRGRPGSKHHLLTDAAGVPLAVSLTGGNRNDITQLIPLVDAVPALRGQPAARAGAPGPRRRPRL